MEPSPIGTILLVSENVSQSHISSFPWRSLSQVFVGVPRYLVQPVCSACLQIALVRPQWGCDLDASSRRSARGKFSPVVVRAAEEHLVDPCGNAHGHGIGLRARLFEPIVIFSRRRRHNINQWAAKCNAPKGDAGWVKKAKRVSSFAKRDRYYAVNITNEHTIEFRLFRGTLKADTILATLQFVTGLCHPFAVKDSFAKMRTTDIGASAGLMHNGVLSGLKTDDTVSDSMAFAKSVLVPLKATSDDFLDDKHALRIIKNFTQGSRFLLMSKTGLVRIFGNWVEDHGIYYSNGNYKPR